MHARLVLGGREVRVDLSQPVDLAVPLDFAGPQPRHFGAPAASARPLEVGEFSGAVTHGASCNCEVITLTPHCNGTHTECVGHLTRERVDAFRVAPAGLRPGAAGVGEARSRWRVPREHRSRPARERPPDHAPRARARLGPCPLRGARAHRAHAPQPHRQAHPRLQRPRPPVPVARGGAAAGGARHPAPGHRPALARSRAR